MCPMQVARAELELIPERDVLLPPLSSKVLKSAITGGHIMSSLAPLVESRDKNKPVFLSNLFLRGRPLISFPGQGGPMRVRAGERLKGEIGFRFRDVSPQDMGSDQRLETPYGTFQVRLLRVEVRDPDRDVAEFAGKNVKVTMLTPVVLSSRIYLPPSLSRRYGKGPMRKGQANKVSSGEPVGEVGLDVGEVRRNGSGEGGREAPVGEGVNPVRGEERREGNSGGRGGDMERGRRKGTGSGDGNTARGDGGGTGRAVDRGGDIALLPTPGLLAAASMRIFLGVYGATGSIEEDPRPFKVSVLGNALSRVFSFDLRPVTVVVGKDDNGRLRKTRGVVGWMEFDLRGKLKEEVVKYLLYASFLGLGRGRGVGLGQVRVEPRDPSRSRGTPRGRT